jgi:hypothetical protein
MIRHFLRAPSAAVSGAAQPSAEPKAHASAPSAAATNDRVTYKLDLVDVKLLTQDERRQIDDLMKDYYAELGVGFDPEQDSDFIDAEK